MQNAQKMRQKTVRRKKKKEKYDFFEKTLAKCTQM